MAINNIELLDGTSLTVTDGIHRLLALLSIQGYFVIDTKDGKRIVVVKDEEGQLRESENPFSVVPKEDHCIFDGFTFGLNIGTKSTPSKEDKLNLRSRKQKHHLDAIRKRSNRWG